jgi:hypothetical protein
LTKEKYDFMKAHKIFFTVFFVCFCVLGYAQSETNTLVATNPQSYQPNIISVIPFQFTENGVGLGTSYERTVDKKGLFAFYIPVMVTFDVANSNRIYDYNTGNYKTGKADAMFYTMPGIKFYPARCYGKIKYAMGASIVIGSGQKSRDITNYGGLNVTEQVQPHFLSGLMWQNSINVNMSTRLYIGVEAGIGETFINKAGGVTESNQLLVQGAFKIGCRF